jgi:Antitoxin VbhA
VPDQEVATEHDRTERQRRVEDAIHSNEMEGLHVNDDTLADADDYVAGRIDSDELVARARARYGLA